MKLPFDFGTRLTLRLLLPGSLLGGAALPAALAARDALGIRVDDLTTFGVTAFVLGWLILLLDMPIYMLFEGRRYWPDAARNLGLARETERLRLLEECGAAAVPDTIRLESLIQLADGFPIDSLGNWEARYPTRLGNLLTAYEEYPTRKYGLDGVFFWYRIWVSIDKDLREELDTSQAVADGSLYLTFSLLISALAMSAYAGLETVRPGLLPALTLSPLGLGLGAGAALVGARILYLSSLHAQRQYGELFKAIFDQHRKSIILDDVVEDLASHIHRSTLLKEPQRVRNMTAWRFLRWHRLRDSRESRLISDW